ncbi:MAG: CHRD domain-containing protein [Vicinamibacteria bacterium]
MNNLLRSSASRLVRLGAIAAFGALASLPALAQTITLSGASEVPPVSSPAAGSGTVTVKDDGSVTAKVTVTGMTAPAAHIHMAAAGANGPVIVPFTKTGDNTFEAAAGAKMTPEQLAAYKAGNTYVNVHSAANPGGEVRAQLKP